MRKFYLILILFAIVLYSCGGSKIDKLKGEWEMTNFESNQHIQNQQDYKNTSKQIMRTTSINFAEDKTFSGRIWNDTSFGTWNLLADSLIITDLASRNKFKVKILTLDYNNLVLEQTDGDLVERLYFSKEF